MPALTQENRGVGQGQLKGVSNNRQKTPLSNICLNEASLAIEETNIHQEQNSLVSLKGRISLKVPAREQADGKAVKGR